MPPDTPPGALGRRHPPPRIATGSAAARFLGAGAANNCGPPLSTGTGVRSSPVSDDPLRALPMSRRGGRYGAAGPSPALDEPRPPGPADGSVATARTSVSSVLRRQLHGQELPPLLPPARQHFTAPTGCHSGPETMTIDPLTIPRAIGRLHAILPLETSPKTYPEDPVWVKVDFSTPGP